MTFLKSLTRQEKKVIAFLILAALAGISYSYYRKAHSQKLSAADFGIGRFQERALKVNINTATDQELMLLKGVGPVTAARIIEYRDKNGPFTAADELKNIAGMGPKKLEAIKEYITVE